MDVSFAPRLGGAKCDDTPGILTLGVPLTEVTPAELGLDLPLPPPLYVGRQGE